MKLIGILVALLVITSAVLSTLFIVAPCEPGYGWRFFAGSIANGAAVAWGIDMIEKIKGASR